MTIPDGPPGPVERLLNAFVLSAMKRRATFLSIEGGRAWLLDGDGWHVEAELEPALAEPLVRRLGVLIGVLPPAKGHWISRGVTIQAPPGEIGLLVRVERADDGVLSALVELVDPAELATRDGPREPTSHPYR